MSNEQIYYDRLKRIAKGTQTTNQLRRSSEQSYGLEYVEALEMAYENMQEAAASAIRGKRRPKE